MTVRLEKKFNMASEIIASNEIVPFNLDFFSVENYVNAFEDRVRDKIYPTSGFEARDGGSLKFMIHGTDWFLDLSDSFVVMKLKLIGKNSANKTPTFTDLKDTKLSVVNNIAHSIFQNIRVKVGNQIITFNDTDYAYKSYLQILLNGNKDAHNRYFRCTGFLKDTAGKMDGMIDGTTVENTENKPLYQRRKDFFSGTGATGQFIMKPHTGICFASKLIPPYMDVEFELVRNENPDFYLMHSGAVGDFRIQILDAKFLVRKYKVKVALVAGLERAMAEGKLLPIKYIDTISNTFSVSKDIFNYHNDTLFQGRIPLRIVIVAVESEAYMGHRNKNPFNFQHFKRTSCRLLKNGTEYPDPEIITNFPDGSDATCMEAFHHFQEAQNAAYSRDVPEISLEEYPNGYFITDYDMSTDGNGALDIHNAAYKPSNIRLEMKFGAALASVVQLVILCDVINLLTTDYKRVVNVTQQ